ncbi:MAG: hypothetical protein IPI85_16080 [Dehalococcoidia bacterium]|nr:hypothetical protein [Dehalococcoidia bacterium]
MTHSGKMSRWTWLMAMVALLAIFAVACSGDDDDDSSSAGFTDAGYKTAGLDKARVVTVDGDIPIGISSALTGEVAGLGIPDRRLSGGRRRRHHDQGEENQVGPRG